MTISVGDLPQISVKDCLPEKGKFEFVFFTQIHELYCNEETSYSKERLQRIRTVYNNHVACDKVFL